MEEIAIQLKKKGRAPTSTKKEIDDLTKINNLRLCGSPVCSSRVVAVAKGIVVHKDMSLLKEYGGTVELTSHSFFF